VKNSEFKNTFCWCWTAIWDDVKRLDSQKDAAIFQAGRYGRPNQHRGITYPSGNALNFCPQRNRPRNSKGFRKIPDDEKARLRKERKCFYCNKPGHFRNECKAKKAKQQRRRFIQSAHITATIETETPDNIEEFLEKTTFESAAT
jgi:hypothetical protein